MTRRLGEAEGYALLTRYGIPVPRHAVAGDREGAADAADAIGYPAVVKVVSPDIIHKSDAGGVRTGVRSRKEAMEAYDAILAAVSERHPGAAVEGVIVEEEVGGGQEFIVGGVTDPAFGKVLTFGSGGVLVELLRDVGFSVLPAGEERIREMVRGIRGYPLIAGYRGMPPLDEEALVTAVAGAARMFMAEERVAEFDINPLVLREDGACAVDARVIIGEEKPVAAEIGERPPFALPAPTSVAVIGASPEPGKVGYALTRNLLSFPGKFWPVNPKHATVLGRTAYPSVLAVPDEVDVAVVAVPAPIVPAVLGECAEKGVPLAVIISAGFSESGAEGREREEEVKRIAAATGIRVLGPNCLGIMLPAEKVNATFDPITPKPGHIGFLSQSGAVITTVADWSIPAGIGFSAVVSVGNQADLGFADLLPAVAAVPGTRAVILYVEEIRDGRRFLEAAKAVTAEVPVIAMKSGASERGKAAASSHTGSLAGSYAVYAAAFREAGILLAGSLEEAFQLGELLASEGYPTGDRCVVISGAGGFAVLAADYAEKHGVPLPPLPPGIRDALDAFLPSIWNRTNPMDIIGDGGATRFARVFDVMIARQDLWDVACVVSVPSAVLNPVELAHEIVRFSRNTSKMVVCCLLGGESMKGAVRILKDHCVPNFPEIEDSFRAVGTVLAAGRRGSGTAPPCDIERSD
ncbi:MAG: acetate--CoA ligase family protein [Methanofollis sp.]|uniref:acetate--CoA ligase family protein n=1 Tax=Methanofollis sp. TaxID=2052835 RepID=UPI0026379638|nr:acetate--CoA ligase family protein [Methanofollis sp.]MDD4255005.1 acetate--CoA ligase family protein [Methanofollis sp.]